MPQSRIVLSDHIKFTNNFKVIIAMGSESVMVTFEMMNQDFVKQDKFDGTNFAHWKDKLMFLLTALKIVYILDLILSKLPEPTDEDTDQVKGEHKKREEDEVVCKGHILNTLLIVCMIYSHQ